MDLIDLTLDGKIQYILNASGTSLVVIIQYWQMNNVANGFYHSTGEITYSLIKLSTGRINLA